MSDAEFLEFNEGWMAAVLMAPSSSPNTPTTISAASEERLPRPRDRGRPPAAQHPSLGRLVASNA